MQGEHPHARSLWCLLQALHDRLDLRPTWQKDQDGSRLPLFIEDATLLCLCTKHEVQQQSRTQVPQSIAILEAAPPKTCGSALCSLITILARLHFSIRLRSLGLLLQLLLLRTDLRLLGLERMPRVFLFLLEHTSKFMDFPTDVLLTPRGFHLLVLGLILVLFLIIIFTLSVPIHLILIAAILFIFLTIVFLLTSFSLILSFTSGLTTGLTSGLTSGCNSSGLIARFRRCITPNLTAWNELCSGWVQCASCAGSRSTSKLFSLLRQGILLPKGDGLHLELLPHHLPIRVVQQVIKVHLLHGIPWA
mmetsp:Transcript_139308/g.347293  ORF Transcript_139308/g.347293 Transcript_139308/m.347293 type:complete len:305 (-) Transcript_139308:2776-3690(-)